MTEPQKLPPASLQDLVEKFGGYDKITHEAWKKYDADLKVWQAQIRFGDRWRNPDLRFPHISDNPVGH
jgi:hypothetical protein